jgi:hypothetical protein
MFGSPILRPRRAQRKLGTRLIFLRRPSTELRVVSSLVARHLVPARDDAREIQCGFRVPTAPFVSHATCSEVESATQRDRLASATLPTQSHWLLSTASMSLQSEPWVAVHAFGSLQ